MMPRSFLVLTILASLSAPLAFAHGDHAHPRPVKAAVSEESAKKRAQEELERLVSEGKVEASWKESGRLRTVEKKGKGEWLATFDNDAVTDKKVLYVFLKASGEFVAANFTGK